MDGACEEMVAVVCDDRPAFRESVVRLLLASGFAVPAVTEAFSAVPGLALAHDACVVVVALPLTGMTGLIGIRALRSRAPHCEIVLVSPSKTLEPAAIEAGARALVPEDDLRVLRALLRKIASARP